MIGNAMALRHRTMAIDRRGRHRATRFPRLKQTPRIGGGPTNPGVVDALQLYCAHRGAQLPHRPAFLNRSKQSLWRNAVYERVRR